MLDVDQHEVERESLSGNRDFKILLTTQGISSLGDAVNATALPLLVLALTGSGFAMGIVAALQTFPDLFVGMIAGAIADRSDRKRMMFLADFGRAGLTALIPLSVLVGGPTMAVILVVAVPLSVLRSFFMAGYTAAVPDLVGRPLVAKANSFLEAVYSTGYIAGPAVAGVLAATIGPGPTLALDAVSFALSGLGLAFVRRDLRAPDDRPETALVAEIREGVDFVVGHPILRSAILYWGLTAIISASLVTALAVYVTKDLGESAAILGLVLAAYGTGTVTGALVMARLGNRRTVAPWFIGGNLLLAAALLVIASVPLVAVAIAGALVAGVAQSLVLVTYLTIRTAYSPDALLGRIGSTARVISFGLLPVGLLVGGAIIDLTSGSIAIAIMGMGLATVSVPFLASSALRRARAKPDPQDVAAATPDGTTETASTPSRSGVAANRPGSARH